jgi:hypothetical protein
MSFKPVYTIELSKLGVLSYFTEMGLISAMATHYDDIPFLIHHLNRLLVKSDTENFIEVLRRSSHLVSNPNVAQFIEQNYSEFKDYLVQYNELWWDDLSKNIGAIAVLEKHLDKVRWNNLSKNPNAIHILEQKIKKINWYNLCANPNAIHILEKNPNMIDWSMLSSNPNAIHMLEKNLNKVYWKALSENPNAIRILEKNLNKVDWYYLSLNPNAIHILEKNLDKIEWHALSKNHNAIHLLEQNFDKIYWDMMALNKNAVHILKNNLDKIRGVALVNLGLNPNIAQILGTLDYKKMRTICQPFAKELAEYVFHPSRLMRVCSTYELDLADYMELIGD